MKAPNHVFFCADAGASIGAGHITRCRTIALALRRRYLGGISFICSGSPEVTRSYLGTAGIETISATSAPFNAESPLRSILAGRRGTALVLDTFNPYFYTKDVQRNILELFDRVVFIVFDDKPHYLSDVVHNQNPRAPYLQFNCQPYTRQLLGLRHVVLSERIRDLAKKRPALGSGLKHPTALVTFGGSDPHNLTTKALRALAPLANEFGSIIVVTGKMFCHSAELYRAIKETCIDVQLISNRSDISDVMYACDIAFTAGGLTNWELGALGKPLIILPAGEPEAISAEFLQEKRLAEVVSDPHGMSIEQLTSEILDRLRPELLENADGLKELINVDGVESLVDAILGIGEVQSTDRGERIAALP